MKYLALLFFLVTGVAHAQDLRAGAAEVDITPPVGAAMAGYYVPRYATGTHDPLHVKAIVIEQGGTKVAMVACDLVSLPRDLSEEARAIVQKKIGLAGAHVMISATHDHTTPVILTNPSRYNLEGGSKRIAEEYTKGLPAKIADAILRANAALQPVQMRAAVGKETTLGFNRRYFMKNGSVGWNPGKLNPNIVRPAGPVDYGVPVLYFESPDEKKPVAAYVNFGVHQDTTGGLLFSGDYSYTLSKVLKLAKGDDFFTLFTIGAAGNVNHIDVSRKEPQQGYTEAARIGAVLAGDVLKTIQTAPVVAAPTIRVSDRIVKIPVPRYTEAEIAEAKRAQASYGKPGAAPFLELVKAARILELNARHGEPLDAEVQVFTFGDQVAIVGFPGEMFAEFGLRLKEDSPFPITIVAELANGAYTYIPNRIAYEEGNYEPTSSRLPEGGGEMLMDSAGEQLLKLAHRDANGK
ncbi:MAG TPA: neutral/alkaline non-lysosomal ceramidase N-terminal domain-containing protein [Acidobacteriaceae bacterium]